MASKPGKKSGTRKKSTKKKTFSKKKIKNKGSNKKSSPKSRSRSKRSSSKEKARRNKGSQKGLPKAHKKNHRKDKPKEKKGGPKKRGASSGVFVEGRVQKKSKGFAFVVVDPSYKFDEDIFLDAMEAADLVTGDWVKIQVEQRNSRGRKRYYGQLEEVLEPSLREGFATLYREEPRSYVILEDDRLKDPIYVSASEAKKAEDGEIVIVKITRYPYDQRESIWEGKIIEVCGDELLPKHDNLRIAMKYNLPIEFPKEVQKEAQKIPDEVRPEDWSHRVDLRDIPFMTIDGSDARDFDDAVYGEKVSRGYRVLVAIADVSHYVKVGSELDKEASERGNSTYFPNQVIPMLPEKLSNGICSLNPHVDRLTMVCEIHFSEGGERKKYKIYPATIHSRKRAIYEDVDEYLNKGKHQDKFQEVRKSLDVLGKIWKKIREKRIERGVLDLDIPEAQVQVDEYGRTKNIVKRSRLSSHMLIEELMIAANEAVTAYMEKLDWPFLFRVHAKPDESSIQEFCKAVNFFGILATPKDFSNPKSLQKLFHELENHPARQTIHYLLLRSMQQAVYSEKNLGHFGLSSEEYTHFTSPIRRYPDLIVHRLIKSSLGGAKSLTKKQKSELNEEIAEISMHCSDKERVSMAAEREVIKLKKVRFIEKYLGDEFEGSVSGVKEKGFFVELTEFFVDGFVPLSDLGDDFYRYIPEKMALVGRRSHRRIKMGDFVKVQVARVDIAQLQVEFHLIEHQPAHRRGAKALKD